MMVTKSLQSIALVLTASACGGDVRATPPAPEDHHWSASATCASQGGHLTNLNALAVLECEGVLPEDPRYLIARSDPMGSLDATGVSGAWSFVVADGTLHYMVSLSESDDQLLVYKHPPVELDAADPCSTTNGIRLLDSGSTVIDAVARLSPDTVVDYGFFDEESDCLTFFTPDEAHVATLVHSPNVVSYAYYDGSGDFLTLCGPCDNGTPRHECATCEP